MANCPVCGKQMAHFLNPDRDICPDEPHVDMPSQKQIEAVRKTGQANKGVNPVTRGPGPNTQQAPTGKRKEKKGK